MCSRDSPARRSSAKKVASWRHRTVAMVVGLLASPSARADHKETYTLVGYQGGLSHYRFPGTTGSGSTTVYAGALDLTAYYGLSNTLHVGGRVRATSSSDVHIGDATVAVPGGSRSAGDVYFDQRSLGFGVLGLYRVDTGYAVAPVVELELGFTTHQYRRIAHVPAGRAFFVSLPDTSETALQASTALLLEYRFRNSWIVIAGATVQVEPGGFTPWSVTVPIRFGRIW